MARHEEERDRHPGPLQPRLVPNRLLREVRVPDEEELGEGDVGPERREREEELPDIVQVLGADDRVEQPRAAHRRRDDREQRDEPHEGAREEIDAEHGRVPVRRERHDPVDRGEGLGQREDDDGGPGEAAQAGRHRGIPRRVLTARAAVVEEGDEGPDSEVERRPDQEERHVEVWRLPAKQRIVLGRVGVRTIRRDRAGRGAPGGRGPPSRGASRRSSPRSVAARSPILPGPRTGSARRRARRGPGSERTGTTRATRRRTASDSPPPESRRPPRPAGRRRRQ